MQHFYKGFQDKCDKIHLSYSLGLNLKNENVFHKNLFYNVPHICKKYTHAKVEFSVPKHDRILLILHLIFGYKINLFVLVHISMNTSLVSILSAKNALTRKSFKNIFL